jgi:hypothetical protein
MTNLCIVNRGHTDYIHELVRTSVRTAPRRKLTYQNQPTLRECRVFLDTLLMMHSRFFVDGTIVW